MYSLVNFLGCVRINFDSLSLLWYHTHLLNRVRDHIKNRMLYGILFFLTVSPLCIPVFFWCVCEYVLCMIMLQVPIAQSTSAQSQMLYYCSHFYFPVFWCLWINMYINSNCCKCQHVQSTSATVMKLMLYHVRHKTHNCNIVWYLCMWQWTWHLVEQSIVHRYLHDCNNLASANLFAAVLPRPFQEYFITSKLEILCFREVCVESLSKL